MWGEKLGGIGRYHSGLDGERRREGGRHEDKAGRLDWREREMERRGRAWEPLIWWGKGKTEGGKEGGREE